MRAITACAAVALSIAPQHANAYPALATYGFGVINTDQDVKADIKDIYNIAARVLCLEVSRCNLIVMERKLTRMLHVDRI
mmetsp:Transcript_20316/g.33220  ORF Transcript_20316/g.33220 Transcript_20316/m.33220 type:complete len:80 (-) Transcript_20316:3310-3549(-)